MAVDASKEDERETSVLYLTEILEVTVFRPVPRVQVDTVFCDFFEVVVRGDGVTERDLEWGQLDTGNLGVDPLIGGVRLMLPLKRAGDFWWLPFERREKVGRRFSAGTVGKEAFETVRKVADYGVAEVVVDAAGV